jgi:hypothetical protein
LQLTLLPLKSPPIIVHKDILKEALQEPEEEFKFEENDIIIDSNSAMNQDKMGNLIRRSRELSNQMTQRGRVTNT